MCIFAKGVKNKFHQRRLTLCTGTADHGCTKSWNTGYQIQVSFPPLLLWSDALSNASHAPDPHPGSLEMRSFSKVCRHQWNPNYWFQNLNHSPTEQRVWNHPTRSDAVFPHLGCDVGDLTFSHQHRQSLMECRPYHWMLFSCQRPRRAEARCNPWQAVPGK